MINFEAKKKPYLPQTTKLTEDDVRAIRASKESVRVLAARYGVSAPQISRIRSGENWRHVH